jgi:hypothetical protein
VLPVAPTMRKEDDIVGKENTACCVTCRRCCKESQVAWLNTVRTAQAGHHQGT